MTWKTDGKLKSAMRKPLHDVSNSVINKPSKRSGVKMNKKTASLKKKKKVEDEQQEQIVSINGDPLHRLLFVHADVSSLLRQIDEVVVQAVKVEIDDKKSEEIKSFTNVLSKIQSSLKPWVLRLQKALAVPSADSDIQLGESSVGAPVLNESEERDVDTPEPMKQESLVSPSPLVSWRATESVVEGGKQLFLLTPLPRPRTSTSKPHASVKPTTCKGIVLSTGTGVSSLGDNSKSDHDKAKNGVSTLESTSAPQFVPPSKIPTCDFSTVLATPCPKSPRPGYCAQQEPYHQFSYRKIDQFHKSTPFPVGYKKFCDLTDSESSSGEVSGKLGQKYPELIGINPSCTLGNERRVLEESPAWNRSPPKCCTLLEPHNEKPVKHDDAPLNGSLQKLTSTFNQQISLAPPKDAGNKKDDLAGNFAMVENTPLWKGSVMRTGKRPGENTLKKELWTRFEAASTGVQLNCSELQEFPGNGFLDLLEEVSGDESRPHPNSSR